MEKAVDERKCFRSERPSFRDAKYDANIIALVVEPVKSAKDCRRAIAASYKTLISRRHERGVRACCCRHAGRRHAAAGHFTAIPPAAMRALPADDGRRQRSRRIYARRPPAPRIDVYTRFRHSNGPRYGHRHTLQYSTAGIACTRANFDE